MHINFSKKQGLILILLGLLSIASLLGGGVYIAQSRNTASLTAQAYLPTGTLDDDGDQFYTATPKPPTDSTNKFEATSTPEHEAPSRITNTPSPSPTRTRSTICNGPPRMMILAVGIDRRLDGYDYGLADVIRAVRVDFISGDVTVLTLPRDLWVKIPGLEDRGITEGKLNQAYYYGSEYYGAYDDPDYGSGLMMDTLRKNYSLSIDRYITVNMQALEDIIDAVGGVDIHLPYNVDGKSTDPDDPFDLGFFPAGDHHFNGETAVRFARIRMMDNDYKRTTRQSMILEALWKKIVSPEILPEIPQLITILSDSVQMNFQAKDIRPLVCLAPLLDEESLIFVNIPIEMLEESRIYVEAYEKTIFVYEVEEIELKGLIRDFQRGFWPTPKP